MDKTRIVITGVSVISSIGTGKDAFWNNLTNGVSGIKPITLFDVSKFNSKQAGEISDFDAKVYLGPKGIRHIDRTSFLYHLERFLPSKMQTLKTIHTVEMN